MIKLKMTKKRGASKSRILNFDHKIYKSWKYGVLPIVGFQTVKGILGKDWAGSHVQTRSQGWTGAGDASNRCRRRSCIPSHKQVRSWEGVVPRNGSTFRDGFVAVAVCKAASKATVEVAKPDPELSRSQRQIASRSLSCSKRMELSWNWVGAGAAKNCETTQHQWCKKYKEL